MGITPFQGVRDGLPARRSCTQVHHEVASPPKPLDHPGNSPNPDG